MPLKTTPVTMPEKKITFKTVNGTIYVYYTLRAYRNEGGKPTSDEIAIGKKDSATGKLIPNRKYFELFQNNSIPPGFGPAVPNVGATLSARVASYGNIFALLEASESIGLRKILEDCFPQKWRQVLATAFYMLCEGNVMMYIDDWFDETDVGFTRRFDDYQCSRLFASISYGERTLFFRKWAGLRSEREYIAYDITSVSTYSENIDIAEWGYNRDGEKIPQANLGMFYGAESCLPVYYDMYCGSVADKSHLAFMMEGAGKMGIANVRFVMDRGFVAENNIEYMNGKGYLFVTALPKHWIEAKKIIDNNKGNVRKSANRIRVFEAYALPVDVELYGFNMRAHVYFDAEKQALEEKELYARVERLGDSLEKIGKNGGVTRKHTEFFVVGQEKTKEFSFLPDNGKIDERLSRAGFFILLSNDMSLSSYDVLRIYRGKDVIEENFDQLKNSLDFRRLRTHVNKTTEGKMFVGFLALILRSYLLRKIKDNPETKQLTLDKALRELRKIKSITFEDLSRILIPTTKTQRKILQTIGVSDEKLKESFV